MSDQDAQAIRMELEALPREELKKQLGDALGGEYRRDITDSIRNDLMEAFFRRVGVNPRDVDLPFETTYDELRDSSIKSYYGPEHALVTALNHYLANRGIRERKPVNSLSASVMASMVADIRSRDGESTLSQ